MAPTQVIPEEEVPPTQETAPVTAVLYPTGGATDGKNVSSIAVGDNLSEAIDNEHVAAADVTDAPTQDTVLSTAGKAKDTQPPEQLAASQIGKHL